MVDKAKPKRGRPATSSSGGQVQSLQRGLLILEQIAEARDGILLTDLALQLGLPASTTHRLLNTLEQQGFVSQREETGLWFIGIKGFSIGSAFLNSRDVVAQARPFMRELVDATGETSNLSLLQGGRAVILAQVQCAELMRMSVPLGNRSPLHASGVGKAMLSVLDEQQVVEVLTQHGLTRFTDFTLATPAALQADLATTRQRGWAYDDQEQAIGLRCVAANIYNENGDTLAAVSISGPMSRITDDRIAELGVTVAKTAAQLTELLGGRPPRWS